MLAGVLVLAASCRNEDILLPSSVGTAIKPVVQNVDGTKAAVIGQAEGQNSEGRLIASYPLSDDPDNELFLQVYERDFTELPSLLQPQTKGLVITTDRLNNDANYKKFYMCIMRINSRQG